jgi:cysteine synthase
MFHANSDHFLAIIMPDDVAEEKVKALCALGADVQRVRPASIVDKKQVRNYSAYSLLVLIPLPLPLPW